MVATYILIQVHRVRENEHFCTNYLTEFVIDLDGILYAVEACFSYDPNSLIPV